MTGYIIQFAPIIAGITVMFLLRRLNISKHRISVYDSIIENGDCKLRWIDLNNIETVSFDDIAYDELVVNGIVKIGRKYANETVFVKSGMIELSKLEQLSYLINKHNIEKIRIFVKTGEEFENYLLRFDKCSGLLLGLMVDGRLSFLQTHRTM